MGTILVNAGVFQNGNKRPAPIEKPQGRWPKDKRHKGPPQEDPAVAVQMTEADVVQTLGLTGNGIGQLVGIRSNRVLKHGLAKAGRRWLSVEIMCLYPPKADILVVVHPEFSLFTNIPRNTIIRGVDVEDLVPVEKHELTSKSSTPLHLGYEPHMPRSPALHSQEFTRKFMNVALPAATMSLAIANAVDEQNDVELVYIPDVPTSTGIGVIQCRTKKEIQSGALRLYPHGGKLVHLKDSTERSKWELKLRISSCYMKALLVSASVGASYNQSGSTEYYIMYSAMSHTKENRL